MEQPSRPFSIRIFLAEGHPSGLRIVEKSNWTGVGVVCPRPRFASAKSRLEFKRAGVYVLLGSPDSTSLPLAYIGEGDPVYDRLVKHQSEKDFWTTAYFFSSKDENLNKAHIQFLEHRLIQIAKNAKRCSLENGNSPTAPSLSEAEKADAESFLDEMLLCFPVLGVSIFESVQTPPKRAQLFQLLRKGVLATGFESADGFVVTAGATAVLECVPSMHAYAKDLRDELVRLGIFKKTSTGYKLQQSFSFASPSTAASILLGASVNGRDAWKTESGETLKEMQARSSDRAT